MFSITAAYAMGGAGAAGAEAQGLSSFIPLILIFAIFYFMLIRPQQKRAKDHKTLLSSLKRGDEVITAGGLYGRIHEITDEYAVLNMGDSKIKVARTSISTTVEAARAVKEAAKKPAKKQDAKDKAKADKQPEAAAPSLAKKDEANDEPKGEAKGE